MAMSQVLFLLNQNIENVISEKLNPRFKVTSFDICGSYIVLGSNSGTLYFLNCDTLQVQQKLVTQSGRIIQIAVAPDDAYLGYATSSGLVYVIKVPGLIPCINLHPVSSKQHEGSTVSTLAWSQSAQDLYIGDNAGYLSLLHIPSNLATSLLLDLTHDLIKFDSSIFQLDVYQKFLLVSTLTKSYILNTRLETYAHIGTKSRQGEYGGCLCVNTHRKLNASNANESLESSQRSESFSVTDPYFNDVEPAVEALSERSSSGEYKTDDNDSFHTVNGSHLATFLDETENNVRRGRTSEFSFKEEIRAFCSRPGLRVWECDKDGKVIATHQLKKAVSIPPAFVVTMNDYSSLSSNSTLEDSVDEDSFRKINSPMDGSTFKKMLRFYDEYLITNSAYGIHIIDPDNSKVLLWTPITEGVKDIKVNRSTALVSTLAGGLHKFQIATVDVAILSLHASGFYELCASVCLRYESIFQTSYLLKRFWKSVINDLLYHVEDQTLLNGIDALRKNIISLSLERQSRSNIWTENYGILTVPGGQLALDNHDDNRSSSIENEDRERFSDKGTCNKNETPSDSYSSSTTPSSTDSHITDIDKRSFEDKSLNDHIQSVFKASHNIWDASRNKTTELLNQANFESVSGVHDVVGNLASNLVSSITSGTKSIRESLANPSPLQKTSHFILQSLDGPIVNGEEVTVFDSSSEDLSGSRKESASRTEPVVIESRNKKTKTKKKLNKKSSTSKDKNLDIPSLAVFLKPFQITVSEAAKLLSKESETSIKEVLTHCLKEYLEINEEVSKLDGADDENGRNNFSARETFRTSPDFHNLVKDFSFVFLSCFQHHIFLPEVEHPDCSEKEIETSSSCPQYITNLDKFYARIIEKDCELIDYRIVMNKFYSLEKHLFLYSWTSLLRKITANHGGEDEADGSLVEVLPDLEFTRAQRIHYLKNLIETGSQDDFLSAASNLHSPSVLFDVYYFCSLMQQNEFNVTFKMQLYDCLHSYLCRISLFDNIVQLYAEHWSTCPEMQFEIFASLLYRLNEVESSCACDLPRPNAFMNRSSSTSFVRALLRLPIYEPNRLRRLFESKSYFTGMFELVCRYDPESIENFVPYVIQSFHRPSIDAMFRHIRPEKYRYVLQSLSNMRGKSDNTITCLKCSSPLPCQPTLTSHNATEPYPILLVQEFTVDSSRHLTSYSSLWQSIICNMLQKIGSIKVLQLFHDLREVLPRINFLKRFLAQSIVCFLAERKGAPSFRWTILQSFYFTDRLLFSVEVRCALDFSVTWPRDENRSEEKSRCRQDPLKPLTYPKDDHLSPPRSEDEMMSGAEGNKESHGDRDNHRHLGTSASAGHLHPVGPHVAANEAVPRANHHWGVKVQLLGGVCHLCQLGLTVEIMVNAGGLTVFSCGHAYHTVCLAQFGRFCVVCHGPNYIRRV